MGVHLAQLQLHPEVVDTVGEISSLLDHPALEGMDHLTSNSKDRQDMEANNSKGRRHHPTTGAVHQHLDLPAVEATDRLSPAHQFQLLPAVGATVNQVKDRQDMDNPPLGHPLLPAVVAMDQPHHVQLHHPEVAATAADLSSNLVHRLETTVAAVAKEADMVVDRLVLQSRFLPAVGMEEIPDLAMALDQPPVPVQVAPSKGSSYGN